MPILHIFMLMFPSAILEFSYIVYNYIYKLLATCVLVMPYIHAYVAVHLLPTSLSSLMKKVFCRNVGNNFCQSVKASVVSQAFRIIQ